MKEKLNYFTCFRSTVAILLFTWNLSLLCFTVHPDLHLHRDVQHAAPLRLICVSAVGESLGRMHGCHLLSADPHLGHRGHQQRNWNTERRQCLPSELELYSLPSWWRSLSDFCFCSVSRNQFDPWIPGGWTWTAPREGRSTWSQREWRLRSPSRWQTWTILGWRGRWTHSDEQTVQRGTYFGTTPARLWWLFLIKLCSAGQRKTIPLFILLENSVFLVPSTSEKSFQMFWLIFHFNCAFFLFKNEIIC